MPADFATFETFGYGLAAAGYLLLTLLLLAAFRQRMRAPFLAIATVSMAVWGAIFAANGEWLRLDAFQYFLLEFALDAAWLLYLASLLAGAVGGMQFRLLRFGGLALAVGILILGTVLEFLYRNGRLALGAEQILIFGQILTALAALVYVEQIYRNSRSKQRRDLKFLCLGIGAIFAYDLLMYSNAVVSGGASEVLWAARGYIVVMALPLLGFAVKRSPSWSGGIFVSRQIVFHSTTIFGAGIYLTFVGIVGQFIRDFGGSWAALAQIVFFSGSVLLLIVLLASDTIRARLRVFISKHFYQNKYDYREEWLRLTETLNNSADGLPIRKRAIKALTEIVGAPTGLLWQKTDDDSKFRCVAGWNTKLVETQFEERDQLPVFLAERGWVIDCHEYARQHELYLPLALEPAVFGLEHPYLIIPLINDGNLLGFVAVSDPASPQSLTYEDRDLLKTAGKQIASYLAQDAATEMLAQSRQFEAYNKLTAYIMHDLKNIIAQQSLVVANAQKHRDNPEFVDDAIETVRAGVARMRRVIEQLRQGSISQTLENVELGTVIMKAVSDCASREPTPAFRVGDQRIFVKADRERLQMAIYHAIRNAQDATPASGKVEVSLVRHDEQCEIRISDTGIGMEESFVRERLFRPFDSTKGTAGMGIGAYQIRETLRQIGGSLEVASEVGQGTTLMLRIPCSG